MAYQDQCLMEGKDRHDLGIDVWRAFRGTLRLCLQTLNTTRNTSTETTVLESFTNLTWAQSIRETIDEERQNDFGEDGVWTTSFGEEVDNFTIDARTTELIAGQIAASFAISASINPEGDNYIYGNMFASGFLSEVLGPTPLECPNNTEHGIRAFDKRIATIAAGVTNA
jgi:hypothetical protein